MTDPSANDQWLAARFDDHRPHLQAVAYRMLGSSAEAEDTVQDAWLRVSRAGARDVENLGGWLTTIVARLALDRLRSRASRGEVPLDAHVPDPVVTAIDAGDPESAAELADSVGLAMLVVLDTLSPAERLAFVLHDTFGLPFEDIGRLIDRSPVAARQLASRARRRVRGSTGARPVSAQRQRELAEAFLAAAREGDLEALLRVLDPEVVVRADTGGASRFGPSRVLRGAPAAARQAVAFRNLATAAVLARINDAPGFVVLVDGRPFAILGFAFDRDRIVEVDVLTDPERLARMDLAQVV